MANAVKQAWQAGKAVVNGWLAIPNAFSAEMYSQCGWDSVTVDMQHGVQDYLSCVACFQGIAASGSGAVPMVRVPWNEPGIVGKVLDAGAMGVISPMVNTKREAADFVSYCRYPPAGRRSSASRSKCLRALTVLKSTSMPRLSSSQPRTTACTSTGTPRASASMASRLRNGRPSTSVKRARSRWRRSRPRRRRIRRTPDRLSHAMRAR